MATKKWTVSLYKGRVKVSDGWFCDWPIQYDNGRIAYDFPGRIPMYVRRRVERFYRLMGK